MSSPTSSSKRKKTMRTYDSARKRTKTMAHTEPEQLEKLRKDNQLAGTGSKDDWHLPATLLDDFAQHNPNAMFSEQSSTVPDNTQSQQRIIQQALLANRSATSSTQAKSNPTQRSESSIPWSAYRDSPDKEGSSPQARKHDSTPLLLTQPLPASAIHVHSASVSPRPPQTPERASHGPTVFSSPNKPLLDKVSSQQTPRAKMTRMRSPVHSNPILGECLSKIELRTNDVIEQQECVRDGEAKVKAGRRKTSDVSPKKSEQDSDVLWIGLPQEQHKPQPSNRVVAFIHHT